MKTSSAKNKGRRLQQFVAKSLAKLFNLEYGQDKDFWSRPMGNGGSDIGTSPRARKLFNYSVECKNTERWNIPKYWKQCVDNAIQDKRIPLLVLKKNRHEELVVLSYSHFEDLLQKSL